MMRLRIAGVAVAALGALSAGCGGGTPANITVHGHRWNLVAERWPVWAAAGWR